jgi:hypothetical protein
MSRQPASRPEAADLPLGYAALALPPILVFLLSELVLAVLAHNSVGFSEQALAHAPFSDPGEAASRLKMLGMAFLVLVSSVGVIYKFVSDMRTYFAGSDRRPLYLAYGMVVAVGVIFLALSYSRTSFAELLRSPKLRLGGALFDRALQGLNPGHSLWGEQTYHPLVNTTHFAVLLAIAAFVAGAISCLARLPGPSEEDNWKFQSERLKLYLFLSAAFLAVSVLYFKSWADYPAFLLTGSELSAYASLSSAYTSFIGIEYSLMLAALALPITYLQAQRADAIAMRIVQKSRGRSREPASTLKAQLSAVKQKEGLELSLADVVKVVLAIIGPFMTGALTNLASAVG